MIFYRNKFYLALDIISILGILLSIVSFILAFLSQSDIPTHFNAQGNVDGYGNPLEMGLLPLMSIVLFVTLTIAENKTGCINVPFRLTENGYEYLRNNCWRLMKQIKCCLMTLMGYISISSLLISKGLMESISNWVMFVCIGLLFACLIRFLYKLYNWN